ncbi:MAG TPA: hypothetical protein VGJ21_10645 [Terracidiphilus sp.]|jgi:hypothetical protein
MGGIKIPVPDWGSGANLTVDISTRAIGVFQEGVSKTGLNGPVPLLVAPDRRGSVTFNVTLNVTHPLHGGVQDTVSFSMVFPFKCDHNGELTGSPPAASYKALGGGEKLEIGVVASTRNDHDLGLRGVKTPPEVRVLHMHMSIFVKVLEPSVKSGTIKVVNTGGPLRGTGSADPRVALIEGFEVELAQPVSKLQGLQGRVWFNKDSSTMEKKLKDPGVDNGMFDTFVKESIVDLYETRVALQFGTLQFRGEARASATYKGTTGERSRYNQQLSEKRRAVVVDYMTKKSVPNANSPLIKAVGDRYGKPGEENVNERYCDIIVTREDLLDAVQQLWMANRYLGH